MKRFAIYNIYIKNISLLLCSGLILTMPTNLPVTSSANKKQKTVKLKLLATPAKPAPAPFSFYNDVVTPLFPALKI